MSHSYRYRLSSRGRYQPHRVLKRQVALTISDLRKVRRETYAACSKWYDIGVELEVPHETLQLIKSDSYDTNSCFTKLYSHWLKMVNPKPTWKALVTALEQPAVGECGLADTLRQKYCPSMKRRRRYSGIVRAHVQSHPVAVWQKALKFIWSHKLMLSILVISVLTTGYVSYKYGKDLLHQISESHSVDETVYQHSCTMPEKSPNFRQSETLPRDNNIFFGRDVELKKLTELIKPTSQTRIISITGSPGFGKSTLAIHAGCEAIKRGYTVVYVDITEVHNVHHVTEKILSQANLEEGAYYKEITEWTRSIRNTTVLILDNCDSVLHRQMNEFQSLLKSICRHSNRLKVIMTAKQETLFVGALQHIQLGELEPEDAVRVLTKSSDRINITFARKLAKRVGNVPLALQVVGALLKDNALSSEGLFSELQKDIIEALSPKLLPIEARVKTSMEVSYRYLNQHFQVCGCILSNFPGIFSVDGAHFVLNKTVEIYMPANPIVWKDHDTNECLNRLVRRSLLTFNRVDHLYKFHQLVREFFQHILKQRGVNDPLQAFVNSYSFELAFQSYSMQQYVKVLNTSVNSCSPGSIRQLYAEAIRELPNHRRVLPQKLQQISDYVFGTLPYGLDALSTLYVKQFDYSVFKSALCYSYVTLLNLEIFRTEYFNKFGSVNYFNMYVTNLTHLGRLESHEYNSSFAIKNLQSKFNFANATELYYLSIKENSIKSHRIYAEYYAMLANMYIRLKDFKRFMDCWQQLLYLRIFKMKCENRMHRCTRMEQGLAAFGDGKYRQAASYLSPYLYSEMVPLHRRARLFVLVYYSYLKLDQPETAGHLLTYDLTLDVHVLYELHDHAPLSSNFDISDIKDCTLLCYQDSITNELLHIRLGITDDLFHDSKKNCLALLIFGTFIEKHAVTRDDKLFGTRLRRKATKFVRYYSDLMLHGLKEKRNGNLISEA